MYTCFFSVSLTYCLWDSVITIVNLNKKPKINLDNQPEILTLCTLLKYNMKRLYLCLHETILLFSNMEMYIGMEKYLFLQQ